MLVDRGIRPRKSGWGVYRHEKDDYTPLCIRVAQQILSKYSRQRANCPRRVTNPCAK